MNVKHKIDINAPASHLWQILVNDFNDISGWATVVLTSGPNPHVPIGEGRVCQTTLGNNSETITEFNENDRTYTYVVEPEKTPFFLKGIENTWTVKPLGPERSEVSMRANVTLHTLMGKLMAPLVRRRMLKGFGSLLEELKVFAETGQVHQRKMEQLSSSKTMLEKS